MIELGIIAKGPGLMKKPIVRDIRRLREALEGEENPAIELAFIIPGRLGHADFDGFELGRRQGGDQRPIVFVAVPPDLANASDPLGALVDLSRQALEFGRPAQDPSTADRARMALERAAAQLGVPSESPQKARDRDRFRTPNTGESAEMAIQVTLPLASVSDLDDAYQLEANLEKQLRERSLGYVDGNEVGEGSFIIFVYGPRSDTLPNAVEQLIRDTADGRGGEVKVLN